MFDYEAYWKRTWNHLKLTPPADALPKLLKAWGEAHRWYHTLEHLEHCLMLMRQYERYAVEPGAVWLALWYHDAVYDPHASTNETESARLAADTLARAGAPFPGNLCDTVRSLILFTRHGMEVHARTPDEQLIMDIDLAILGASPKRFERYEQQIREEYAFVPEDKFREARARILRGFIEREHLYINPVIASRFQARARANLARSITALEDGPSTPMDAVRRVLPNLTLAAIKTLSQPELASLHDTLTAAARVVGVQHSSLAAQAKGQAAFADERGQVARTMWRANRHLQKLDPAGSDDQP